MSKSKTIKFPSMDELLRLGQTLPVEKAPPGALLAAISQRLGSKWLTPEKTVVVLKEAATQYLCAQDPIMRQGPHRWHVGECVELLIEVLIPAPYAGEVQRLWADALPLANP